MQSIFRVVLLCFSLVVAAVFYSRSTHSPHVSFPLTLHKESSHSFAPHPAIPHSAIHDLALGHRISSSSVDVAHSSAVYTITVGVGSPPQLQTLLVDTGSADMLVFSSSSKQCRSSAFGCGGGYNPLDSRTSHNLDMSFVFGFANQSATARGSFVRDDVHIGKFLVRDQPFAMIEDSVLDFDIEGVLGLGYKSRQQSDFKYETLASKITTAADQRIESNMRVLSNPHPMFALYLGSRNEDHDSGIDVSTSSHSSRLSAYFKLVKNSQKKNLLPKPSLDLGFIDESKHAGDMMAFIPCITDEDFSLRVQDIKFVSHNNATSLLPPTSNTKITSNSEIDSEPGIGMLLDSGTIGILIDDQVADSIASSIFPNATYDNSLPGYRLPCSSVSTHHQGHLEFSFSVSSSSTKTIRVSLPELRRQLLSSQQQDDECVLDIIRESTYGVGNVLGTSFMSSVYAAFDVDRHRVGLAQAAFYKHRLSTR
ncbi:aspartic peptidase domain-containing protein [Kockiozyma suomiensis]|uniref:aspartic peptidase domain-containing protein n=1 Tax=Kockiozyma suomiensis TaxID=1337062 RepID=UPI0033438358